jgi:hypothetical protein
VRSGAAGFAQQREEARDRRRDGTRRQSDGDDPADFARRLAAYGIELVGPPPGM